MDNLRDLVLFVEAARARSFAKAARRLGLPAAKVAASIAELEARIDVKLLQAADGAVELTDAGALYLRRCAALVDGARRAHEDLTHPAPIPRGQLRVSLTGDFGTVFFAPYLVEFGRLYPQVAVDLDLSPRRIHLLGEPFDLALRIGPLQDRSLIARRLALLRVAPYAAPVYVGSRGAPKRPEDLAKHDAIRIMHGAGATHWTLNKGKDQRRVPLGSSITADSFGMIRTLALLGAGIGLIEESMARKDVLGKRLVRVLPQWTIERIPVHAISASRLLPANARALVEFLTERLKRPDGASA